MFVAKRLDVLRYLFASRFFSMFFFFAPDFKCRDPSIVLRIYISTYI